MRGKARGHRRRAVIALVLVGILVSTAGALPARASVIAPGASVVVRSVGADSEVAGPHAAVPSAGLEGAESVVRTLLPNYNASLPGNFPSTVYDWAVGAPAVVPTTGTIWLPEYPVAARGPPAPIPAPALIYNISRNTFVGTAPGLANASALVYDPADQDLYACDPATNSVEVFDPISETVVRPAIPVGLHPDAIGFDSENQYLFVANGASDNVTVINGKLNEVIPVSVPTGHNPVALAVDVADGLVYLANSNSSFLSVVNATDPSTLEPHVGLALGPATGVAYSESGGTVAAVSPSSVDMTIVDAATGFIEPSSIRVGEGTVTAATSSDGATFVVANGSGSTVSFVAASSPYSLSGTSVRVGDEPVTLTSVPSTDEVAAWSRSNRTLSLVDISSESLIRTSPSLGMLPNVISSSYESGSIYVGNSSVPGLTIVNPTTGASQDIKALEGITPDSLASDDQTHILYVGTSGAVIAVNEVSEDIALQNSDLSGPCGPMVVDSGAGVLWVGQPLDSDMVALSLSTLEPVGNVTGIDLSPAESQSLALDTAQSEIFVINSTAGKLSAFDAMSGAQLAYGVDAGTSPSAVIYDPVDGLVYAAGSALTAIDPATDAVVGSPLALPNHVGPDGLLFDPSRGLIDVSTTSPGTDEGTLTVVGATSVSDLSAAVETMPVGWGPAALDLYAPPSPNLNGSDIVVSANVHSGTISLIASSPSIASFEFSPSAIDVGQSSVTELVASGGAGTSTIQYFGLPTGCDSESALTLLCSPSVNGTFNVRVTITDSLGQSVSAIATLDVGTRMQLKAMFGSAATPEADVGVPFSVSALASGGTSPYTYAWNFSDGTTALGEDAVHTFAAPGTYSVTVTATDSVGAFTTDSAAVEVYPGPVAYPVAIPQPTTDVGLPLELESNVSGGAPPGSADWTFGDHDSAIGLDVSHSWSAAGEYRTNVSYRDDLGVYSNASISILVDPLLTARFSASPSSTPAGPGTVFEFAATIVGGTPSYSVLWSFGNGSFATGLDAMASFRSAGNHTVEVSVTDAVGAHLSTSVSVSVGSTGHSSSILSGNFAPGIALGLFLGAAAAAALLFIVEHRRRRTVPSPPSPYVPPANLPGKRG